MMHLSDPTQTQLVNEVALLLAQLPIDNAHLLELGCGTAEKTRTLAANPRIQHITALEIDPIQHARHLTFTDLPQVTFIQGIAQDIPLANDSVDVVVMFKSLHHVPVEAMDTALTEIARVLKPGGFAWISEPVFAGALNEVTRLFNDEEHVREAAFMAVRRAVGCGLLRLKQQLFFHTRSHFDDFTAFEQRMIRATHSNHELSPTLLAAVADKFNQYLGEHGATFHNPQRVDVLEKPHNN